LIYEDSEILKFKEISKVETAACVLHKGSYAELREAYTFVYKWIEDNNYEATDNPRESYIDGIWNELYLKDEIVRDLCCPKELEF